MFACREEGSGSFSPVPRSEGGLHTHDTTSANRPSEHSGEKVSEPDDPGRSPGSKLPTKNVRNNWPDVTARDKSRNSQTEALPGGDSAVLPSRNAYLGHLPEVEHFIDLRIRQHMLALD